MSWQEYETITDRERNLGIQDSQSTVRKRINWGLLLLYSTFTAIGTIGGPLLQRLYYIHGGNRKWLSSWLQSVGFPFLLVPLTFLYFKNLSSSNPISQPFFMEPNLFIFSALLGLLLGLDNYMYSVGLFYIPVSTSSLLFSTQLAFTAVFAFLIVKQKFTFPSLNSVVLITLGALVLALHTSSDRPSGVSNGRYFFGFFFTLGGAALLGLLLPLIELSYRKNTKPITYIVVIQYQFVMSVVGTGFCTIGMLINKDFQIIPREAREYKLGEVKYYMVLVASAIAWQFVFIGMLGVIHCTSSLFAGILSAVLLPFTQIAAVVAYGEKFSGEKGMSLALCLWGFTSYFVGEYKKTRRNKPTTKVDEESR